jgi:hypothetical protein
MTTALEKSLEQWLSNPSKLDEQFWWQCWTALGDEDPDRVLSIQAALTRLQGDKCWDIWRQWGKERQERALCILAAHLLRLEDAGNVVLTDLLSEGRKGA